MWRHRCPSSAKSITTHLWMARGVVNLQWTACSLPLIRAQLIRQQLATRLTELRIRAQLACATRRQHHDLSKCSSLMILIMRARHVCFVGVGTVVGGDRYSIHSKIEWMCMDHGILELRHMHVGRRWCKYARCLAEVTS